MHTAIDSQVELQSSDAPLRVEPQFAPPGALPAEVEAAVGELRALLDRERGSFSEAAGIEADAHFDDLTLARFVLARPRVDQACTMFRDTMAWRAAIGIGRLRVEMHPVRLRSAAGGGGPPDGQLGVRAALVQRHFYAGFGGVTRDGAPFWVERLGQADLGGYAREPGYTGLMLDGYTSYLETLFRTVRACSAASGTLVKATLVVDVSGVSLSLLRHVSVIKLVTAIGPPYFPECTRRVLLVNAPRVVAMIWSAVSHLLPKHTKSKVAIVSAAATAQTLADEIDLVELPTFLGGQRRIGEGRYALPRAEPVPVGARVPPARDQH